MSSCSRAIPASPSGNRAQANRWAAVSCSSTSWWSSAQSSPTNNTLPAPLVRLPVAVATGRTACGLMARCSRPPRAGFGHVIPSAVHGLPTTARVTFSAQGSRSLQARGVITRRRLPPPRVASRPGLPHEARGQGPDAVRSRSNAAGALDQRKKPNARVDLAKWCWRRARCPRWWRRPVPPPRVAPRPPAEAHRQGTKSRRSLRPRRWEGSARPAGPSVPRGLKMFCGPCW